VEAAQSYSQEGADELVFLDIFAIIENRKTRLEWVEEACNVVTVPFAAGGGLAAFQGHGVTA